MDVSVINVTAIERKMKDIPKGQRLHLFFKGNGDMLSPEQIADIDEIVEQDYKTVKAFLGKLKKKYPVKKMVGVS